MRWTRTRCTRGFISTATTCRGPIRFAQFSFPTSVRQTCPPTPTSQWPPAISWRSTKTQVSAAVVHRNVKPVTDDANFTMLICCVVTLLTYYNAIGWLGNQQISVLDSGTEGPGFKSQPRRCRVTVLGELFTPIVPVFTKQRNWYQPS